MKLYLIGMPGCGKSTLGKKLASRLGYSFIDMDSYIEKKMGMFVEEIFTNYGEDYFRALEVKTLVEFRELDNVIIATGGGVIKIKANKSIMDGKCVFLEVPLDELEKRLSKSNIVRPLLKTNTVYDLYEERKALYDYFTDIKVSNVNVDEAIDKIMEALK